MNVRFAISQCQLSGMHEWRLVAGSSLSADPSHVPPSVPIWCIAGFDATAYSPRPSQSLDRCAVIVVASTGLREVPASFYRAATARLCKCNRDTYHCRQSIGRTKAMTNTPQDESYWLAYVDATARLQALPLDPTRREEVARQLQRIAAMAAPLMAFELTMRDEVAPIFIP